MLFSLRKDGYVRVKIDGEMYDLANEIELSKTKKHNISVVVDRLILKEGIRSRLYEAVEASAKLSHGKVIVDMLEDGEVVMSENFACPYCDYSLEELEPRIFSFNAPYGSCPDCKGLGVQYKINVDLVIPDRSKSINEGAISTISVDDNNTIMTQLRAVSSYYGIDLDKPVKKLTSDELDIILYGSKDLLEFNYVAKNGNTRNVVDYFEGIITNLERRYIETKSGWIRDWIEQFMMELPCQSCGGSRLKPNVLSVLVGKKNIFDLTKMSIKDLRAFLGKLKLSREKREKCGKYFLTHSTNIPGSLCRQAYSFRRNYAKSGTRHKTIPGVGRRTYHV